MLLFSGVEPEPPEIFIFHLRGCLKILIFPWKTFQIFQSNNEVNAMQKKESMKLPILSNCINLGEI